jgi:hypothetical protein
MRRMNWVQAATCAMALVVAPMTGRAVAQPPPHAPAHGQDKVKDKDKKDKNDRGTHAQRRNGHADWDRRFHGLDRDGNGVINREEWDGDDRAFAVHDWNRDGVLAGDELRAGATPPPAARNRNEPDHVLFARMDANSDGRVTRNEWTGTARTFERLDANDDGALSAFEYGVGR